MNVLKTVYVEQPNKFKDIKYKFDKLKENRNKVELIYDYEILHDGDVDNKYLMEYCIYDAPFIRIADGFRTGMKIFIKTIDDKILTFEMEHSNKIKDVKRKIQEKIKLSADQQNLFFQGEILDDDDKSIDEYQICDKSLINVVAILRGGMHIFAKTMDGKSVALEVFKSDKIIDIKYKIQEKTELHPDDQKLIYQGVILENEKTIDEYQVCDQSVINIVVRLRGLQIIAKTLVGKTVAFAVQSTDKIIDIKQIIQEKTGLRTDDQKLSYQGVILQDDKTVDEYQITDKSVINVIAKLRGGIQIFATTMDGKDVTFEVKKSVKMRDVKYKIQEKTGMHADEQKFVYQGENGGTIDDYQLCNEDEFYFFVRPRGMLLFAGARKEE